MKPLRYSLSYWTLRLNDPLMNEKYLKCQRKEVLKQTKYLLIAHILILSIVLLLALAYIDDDEKRSGYIFIAALSASPTIFLGLAKALAKCKVFFVDLFGMAYLIGTCLSLVILLMTDWIEISPVRKITLDSSFFLFYVIYMGLLNSNFFLNFIARTMIYVCIQGFLVY